MIPLSEQDVRLWDGRLIAESDCTADQFAQHAQIEWFGDKVECAQFQRTDR